MLPRQVRAPSRRSTPHLLSADQGGVANRCDAEQDQDAMRGVSDLVCEFPGDDHQRAADRR
jgi:hypothetical protein